MSPGRTLSIYGKSKWINVSLLLRCCISWLRLWMRFLTWGWFHRESGREARGASLQQTAGWLPVLCVVFFWILCYDRDTSDSDITREGSRFFTITSKMLGTDNVLRSGENLCAGGRGRQWLAAFQAGTLYPQWWA